MSFGDYGKKTISATIWFYIWFSICSISVSQSPRTQELTILHNNGLMARFEEITETTGYCTDANSTERNCLGGFARMSTVIKQYRNYAQNSDSGVIYLFAGGLFTGSIWFSLYQSKIAAEMMNLLAPDAMSLGYTEFDSGTEELANFVNNVTFPVISANIDVSKEPRLSRIIKSTVLDIKGNKIGVVGHIVERSPEYSAVNENITFSDELTAIRKEAKNLKSQGAVLVISLGYSDMTVHKHIANDISDVDVVVGSMVDHLFYNGRPPGLEEVEGPYPQVIYQMNGKRVPIITTYGFTKYLGVLNITYSRGKVESFAGQPIYMEADIAQDEIVLAALDKYRPEVDKAKKEVLGVTRVPLEGGKTARRLQETNFGNLLADAIVDYGAGRYFGKYWTDAPAAFVHNGMIMNSLDLKSVKGKLTRAHLLEALPLAAQVAYFSISGKYLKEALEQSITLDTRENGRQFLQYSGIHVEYDMKRSPGKRVTLALIRCENCTVPFYSDIIDDKTYNLIAPTFILGGKLGYSCLKRHSTREIIPDLCTDILIDYVKKMKCIAPVEEERIIIRNKPSRATKIKGDLFIVVLLLFLLYDNLISSLE